ncbi:hypothetical protein GW7_10786 [Heterocephalus glaber]|uniref:Uncharacterized protein n=1 Tax=Heterocephalus glaber TaxID=10181 RepID=G5BX60_HETGA|nr:hypothetical protein GW7_10786 [Heterocephalus glaber]
MVLRDDVSARRAKKGRQGGTKPRLMQENSKDLQELSCHKGRFRELGAVEAALGHQGNQTNSGNNSGSPEAGLQHGADIKKMR